MDRIRRDTLLGLVFFGTLAFLLWATVNLTDLSLGKAPPLQVYFEDGGGAPPGTNVLVLGKKIGKTGEAQIDYRRPEFRVLIPLLLGEVVPLTVDYRIEVQDAGVLGGKQVYIDPGRGAPLPAGRELRGFAQKGAFEKIGDIADGKGALGDELKRTLTSIRTLFESLRDDQNSIGQLTTNRQLYDEVLRTVTSLRSIFDKIQDGQSVLGRLAVDTQLGDRFQLLVENLAKTSDALTGTDGTLGLLLNDRATAGRVRDGLRDLGVMLADLRDGQGALGRLLREPKLGEDLAAAAFHLRTLLEKANDKDAGLFGMLSSDGELAKDAKQLLANLRLVSERLNSTETPLGILISDKDAGTRLRRILNQVSRAIEDAREAAPIGNFVQVLLGVL
ncbi:MAG: MCE family protein [Planctomycetes bacterium]|nr:MCE family protein [Planctomycetota bacterium]